MAKRPVRTRKTNFLNNKKAKFIATKKIRGITKRFIKPQVQDVRQKLIQKKRKNVVDARDILAKMAKNQDARNKLNKIRENKVGIITSKENVKAIGSNILRKTDRNGQISLVTNKSKNTSSSSGMNIAIQKELGLISSTPRKPVLKLSPKIPVHTIRQTVLNDLDYPFDQIRGYDQQSLYKWAKPELRTAASQLIGSLEARKRAAKEEVYENWPTCTLTRSLRIPSGYVDLDAVDDEEMPMAPPIKQTISLQGSSRISNVHSRLDSSPIETESHGIFSQTKTKVVVPAGHRIVVSNLQPTVTQDDVKELFEDIGQLLAARLVRPGVAEVIYKNLKDAQKAVDTYHNRQLDGQPMKCLLVNKRPLNNPTAPALADSQGIMSPKEIPATSTSSNKLIPDISTIHKVLFQRK